MTKKILTILLAGVMLLCLAACAGESGGNGQPVFDTENIVRITIYSYYGHGTGCDVPSENMEEMTNWLGTFKVGAKMYADSMPPGTNTIFVEIEYENGTVVKQGLEAIEIDGQGYYLEYSPAPDCFNTILNNTSLT